MKRLKKYIYTLNKEELFILGFYISIIFVMLLAAILDFNIQNYIDVYFELFFAFFTILGLIYFYYSKNINIANHVIVIVATMGSYVFLITSNFTIPIFVSIVSLAYFLLFSLKRSLLYSAIHQTFVAFIYTYGYLKDPNHPMLHDFTGIVATFMASILMILLGIVYHFSVENSYKRLYKSNREKEILLQELNHRVKNNLQIILSIIELQREQSIEKENFNHLINRINAIAKSYELLLVNHNLQSIDMNNYINTLLLSIQDSFLSAQKKITFSINTSILLGLKEATYIGLVINELITNSYKYAFTRKDKGSIEISFTKKKAFYYLIIEDDGEGFTLNKTKKSLGLELVHSLIQEQLQGTVQCNCDNGTHYHIQFPIPKDL